MRSHSKLVGNACADTPDPEIMIRLSKPGNYEGAVTVDRSVLQRLKQQGLVYDAVISQSHIGLHPCNRGQYRAKEASLHSLLAVIFEVGWNPDEIATPIAIEECPLARYSDLLARGSTSSHHQGRLAHEWRELHFGLVCTGLDHDGGPKPWRGEFLRASDIAHPRRRRDRC